MYDFFVKVISVRTGIPPETVKAELYDNPLIFHTFTFSKFARFQAKERII